MGMGKTGLNSEVVLILGGFNSDNLLYSQLWISQSCSSSQTTDISK